MEVEWDIRLDNKIDEEIEILSRLIKATIELQDETK